MDDEKRNEQRRQKRRQRLSVRGSSVVSDQSNADCESSSSSATSTFMSRTSWRESRKRNRRGAQADKAAESGTRGRPSIPEEESVAEESVLEEPDIEEDFHESQRQSLYSLPGAFRVSRKIVNHRQVEEIALEEVSIESYSTAKTPPVVIPSASLVQESLRKVNDEDLAVAFPETNVLLVTKRHFFICIALSCIAFGGLFTGLLFALWERPTQAGATGLRNGALSTQNRTIPPKPSWHEDASNDQTLATTVAPTFSPTNSVPTSLATGQPTAPIVASTQHSASLPPTYFPSQSPLYLTAMPTSLDRNSPAPTSNVNGGFSLTSAPVASPTLAQTNNPTEGGR